MLIKGRRKTDRITTLVLEKVIKQVGLDGLQGGTCRGSCLIWQSCNHAQHIDIFCRRIGFIPLPRTRGRARTRAARDFLKTIVAYTRVGDKRCYESRAWNAGLLYIFCYSFRPSDVWQSAVRVSDNPFESAHPELRFLHMIHPGLWYTKDIHVYFGHEFLFYPYRVPHLSAFGHIQLFKFWKQDQVCSSKAEVSVYLQPGQWYNNNLPKIVPTCLIMDMKF